LLVVDLVDIMLLVGVELEGIDQLDMDLHLYKLVH
jgi:hypothetical protein